MGQTAGRGIVRLYPLPGWIGTRQPRCSFKSGVQAPAATTNMSAASSPWAVFGGQGTAVRASKTLERTVLADRRSAGFEDAPPGDHQLVGAKMGIVVIVPAAGKAGPKRRLELEQGVAVIFAGPGS